MSQQSKIEWTDSSWTPIRARDNVALDRAGRLLDGVEHSAFPALSRVMEK